jgi:hypothetical protein
VPGRSVCSAPVRCIATLALVALLAAGCSGGGTVPPSSSSSSTPVSTTPTTDPGADCRRLAEDAVAYLEEVVAELDGITPAQLADRAQWPDALADLEVRGEELDRRTGDLGCDLGAVQQEVILRAAELQAQGPVAQLLLDLLLGRVG